QHLGAGRGDDDVPAGRDYEVQELGRLDHHQDLAELRVGLPSQAEDLLAAADVVQELEEAHHFRSGYRGNRVDVHGLSLDDQGENLVRVLVEALVAAVPRALELDPHLAHHPPGPGRQHHDAVGEQHGFLDHVGHHEDD